MTCSAVIISSNETALRAGFCCCTFFKILQTVSGARSLIGSGMLERRSLKTSERKRSAARLPDERKGGSHQLQQAKKGCHDENQSRDRSLTRPDVDAVLGRGACGHQQDGCCNARNQTAHYDGAGLQHFRYAYGEKPAGHESTIVGLVNDHCSSWGQMEWPAQPIGVRHGLEDPLHATRHKVVDEGHDQERLPVHDLWLMLACILDRLAVPFIGVLIVPWHLKRKEPCNARVAASNPSTK